MSDGYKEFCLQNEYEEKLYQRLVKLRKRGFLPEGGLACSTCLHCGELVTRDPCRNCDIGDAWESRKDYEWATQQKLKHTTEVNITGLTASDIIVDDIAGAGTVLAGPVGAPVQQKYPDDNPKTVLGVKKPGIANIPPAAIMFLGEAMSDGAVKYGRMNYRDKNVTSSVYIDAAWRHLSAWWDGEEYAKDSGIHHLGHAMACFAIILDAQAQDTLNDDRPIPGKFPELVIEHTKKD